jgi:hypothetical protein
MFRSAPAAPSPSHVQPSAPSDPLARRGSGEVGVRAMRADDVPALARLYLQIFRGREGEPSARLQEHVRRVFLDHPRRTQHDASLVYEAADGEIAGMFGVLPTPMLLDGRPVPGAVISTWMARPGPGRARAATRLVRAHLKRGHAISITNTANATSMSMQQSLRFRYAATHSLEWFKVLNFSAYAAAVAARRAGGRLPAAAARAVHAAESGLRRALGRAGLAAPAGWSVAEASPPDFAARLLALSQRFRFRPDWRVEDIVWALDLAAERRQSGPLRLCEARDDKGEIAGVFAYYAPPTGRAEALQIVARPHADAQVLRAFVADAAARRCAYVCGAAGPLAVAALFDMPGVFFRQTAGTAFRADSDDIANAVAYGEGLVGGLVGDGWTPLATESYEE